MTDPAGTMTRTEVIALMAKITETAILAMYPDADRLEIRRSAARGAMRGLRANKPPAGDPPE